MDERYLPVSEMKVASWSPNKDVEGVPPTQVHIVYRVPNLGARFVMRLKSREAVNRLIAALIEHRDHVWGKE